MGLTLILGDTHYANSTSRGKKWRRTIEQFQVGKYLEHLTNTPVSAIYDDHDFIDDDVVGAGNRGLKRKKEKRSRRAKASRDFYGLWPISRAGHNTEQGCFHKIEYGLVDIYMLDTRFYREPKGRRSALANPKWPERRHLSLLGSNGHIIKWHKTRPGAKKGVMVVKKGQGYYSNTKDPIGNIQWEWLEKEFGLYKTASDGNKRVKILCFGSTIKNLTEDYSEEIEKLKTLLSGHTNVVFLSGDIHSLKFKLHKDFGTNQDITEITSSGIGRTKKKCSKQKVGGFAILEIFPKRTNKIVYKFYQPSRKDKLPANGVINLVP